MPAHAGGVRGNDLGLGRRRGGRRHQCRAGPDVVRRVLALGRDALPGEVRVDVRTARAVATGHLGAEVPRDDRERGHAGPGDAVEVKPLASERTGAAHGEKDGRRPRRPTRHLGPVWHDAPMASDLLSEEWSWRGRRVRWGRWGTGPDVVFCHGTPWSSALWAPYAQALSATCTVHLWDMPGYGASSMDPDHAVSLDVQGQLLADLLDHWALSAPHVVAHDIGGAVALRAHLLHGRSYASLALVDVVALAPWGSDYFRLVSEHADVFAAVPSAMHEGALRAYIAGRESPRPVRARPRRARGAVARRPGAAGVLPPGRSGIAGAHRRDRAALPRPGPAGAGRVGHRRHLDPRRPRAPSGRADPRRPAQADHRCRSPGAARPTRRTGDGPDAVAARPAAPERRATVTV